MADNVPITAGAGTAIAADEVADGVLGTVKVQYIKLMAGALDDTGKIGGDATNGLDVDVTRVQGVVSIIGSQPTISSGTITTATSTVAALVTNYGNATIAIFGTYAGVNITFEASPDGGTTYFPIQVQRETDGGVLSATGVLTANTAALFSTSCPGYTHIRARATAYTSGTANVIIAPGSMPFEPVVSIGNAVTVAGQGTSTSAVTNVAASATNVTLKAANTSRKALYIFNAGIANLFVKLGATATATTSFTYMIPPNGLWELPDDPIYTGQVDGIWTATGGSGANVTELT
jgi:hypothetical protein